MLLKLLTLHNAHDARKLVLDLIHLLRSQVSYYKTISSWVPASDDSIVHVCKCTHGDVNILLVELSVCALKDVSYLALELVKPVFDRAGLSAPHSGEWFIGRPRLHGDTKTRSGPLFVLFFLFQFLGSTVLHMREQGKTAGQETIIRCLFLFCFWMERLLALLADLPLTQNIDGCI